MFNTLVITDHTIVAIATPPGRGGVGIVRVSGPKVAEIAEGIIHKPLKPRYAIVARFFDQDQEPIDEGIVLYFPAPNSFTGEDVLELHGHGGPVVLDRLLKRCMALGARQARPGEFSERAFLNNKIDLAQAEAIADLIDAESTQAAQSALRSLQGGFSKCIAMLVEKLIQLRMYVEAAINFPEEEIDFLADEKISQQLNSIITDLSAVQKTAKQGSLLREGMTVVIAGKPNAGKSSLLNQLSGQESAIVTEIPGTTRDILREYIHIDGLPLHIIDTAGLCESPDIVEKEGIRRAYEAIQSADRVLFMVDCTNHETFDLSEFPNAKLSIIYNKIDLKNAEPRQVNNSIYLSAKTGAGINLLKEHLKQCVGFQTLTEGQFSARRRHIEALQLAAEHLVNAKVQLEKFHAGELLAEELNLAQRSLGEITGEFHSDDLLGRIFAGFCIGK